MRELLIENQQRRALHLRRKNAAVKIATWYKSVLVERRHRYLIESCQRFKNFSTAAISRLKQRARRRCAARMLDFMQREVSNNKIATAVFKLRRYTVVIQRCWRNRVAAREAQITLLTLQLTKFEGRLLAYNRRKAMGNNANVFAATVRKTVPLHEELKMTLAQSTNLTVSGTSVVHSRTRRVKMDDEEDTMTPQQMLFLNTLTVRLPKSIKDQVPPTLATSTLLDVLGYPREIV